MLKTLGKDISPPTNKQVQFLENKVNKLRWVNDDLSKQVFDAIHRGHRLAAKLGYKDLDDAERALATQTGGPSQEQQSQLELLSQQPSDELAAHIQALQSELISHVQLSKTTLSALGDAIAEIAGLREANEQLNAELERERRRRVDGGQTLGVAEAAREAGEKESAARELAFARAELAALKTRYADLRKVKEEAEEKHAADYQVWRQVKDLIDKEKRKEERAAKRRKPNPEDDGGMGRTKAKISPAGEDSKKEEYRRVRKGMLAAASLIESIVFPSPEPDVSEVLTGKSVNSSLSSSITHANSATPSKSHEVKPATHKLVKRASTIKIPDPEDVPASSETEPDSQPVKYVYPSQLDVKEDGSRSTIPQKRPRSPAPDSSETEVESQTPTYIFPSQIVPLTPAQVADMTPKPSLPHRRTEQLFTPVSTARPQPPTSLKFKASLAEMPPPPSSSPPHSGRARGPLPALNTSKPRLPNTPVSRPIKNLKKGKERATENDENVPASTPTGTSDKKTPADYSIYKGRGRYGAEVQAGKENINALFQIDPERNNGVGFQFEEVVRDKEMRKRMHAGDCECCRDYYEAVGPLPSRLKAPMWRSPQSSPTKKGGLKDSFGSDEDENAAIEEHKKAISRHRHHWERAETPPGYWNIGFPDTQEVEEMNAEAQRMHERKRAFVADEAERGGKYKKRS